ncbi:cutinase family protein [Jongsikchunia kroppenstedtii]|uniref:cutinase family protein n=1 Tax=Jongsikchunia kroppenstedtii TaxID=1121721 RepID=UPI000363D72F|nr:cutinase family protein [Jongsikchunia kroppenstedtii]
MRQRPIAALFVTLFAAAAAFVVGQAPATAAPAGCPDVEMVFARGTAEAGAPMGLTGLSFLQALQNRLPGRSVVGYAVNYPASSDFNNRVAFAQTVINGVVDAQNRVKFMASTCPRTRVVLGGYSQGSVVAGYAANGGTIRFSEAYQRYQDHAPPPLPAAVMNHVAAVVLFAEPSPLWISQAGAPPVDLARVLAGRTTRYCFPGDTICDGAPLGGPNALHVLYSVSGFPADGANFVASRL